MERTAPRTGNFQPERCQIKYFSEVDSGLELQTGSSVILDGEVESFRVRVHPSSETVRHQFEPKAVLRAKASAAKPYLENDDVTIHTTTSPVTEVVKIDMISRVNEAIAVTS